MAENRHSDVADLVTACRRLTWATSEESKAQSLSLWLSQRAILPPAVLVLAAATCISAPGAGSPAAVARQTTVLIRSGSSDGPVEAELRNVDFHADPGAVLEIRYLRGELLPTEKGSPASFDDRNSFTIKIGAALIEVTAASLAALMNGYVFAYRNAPLRHLKISVKGGRLILEGALMKGVAIPFQGEGELSATPEGLIRLHLTGIKSAHVPVKGLMDLLGIKMADLINLNPSRGARVQGDDILLDPGRILPPPRIQGRASTVAVQGEGIVLRFEGEAGKAPQMPLYPPRPEARNYMYFRGGTLRFGRLTMTDADLQIIDTDPSDSFDFDLSQYNRQLVAGYCKSTPAYGLIVFMPDLHRLSRTGPHQTSKVGLDRDPAP